MVLIAPLDDHVDHDAQVSDEALEQSNGPVVLVNIFHVDPEHGEDLLAVWGEVLRRFRTAPGFISAQFHRGTAGSGTFLNYAVWESARAYRDAFADPAFQGMLDGYPPETVATPHLFTKQAITGVCTA
jgi:heme-degrading monooxygenase HmoA